MAFIFSAWFEEIVSLLSKNNNNVKKYVDEINNTQSSYDLNLLEKIISNLDQNKLKYIDDEIKNVDFSKINLEANPEKFALKYKKSISLYREFILIREKIYNEIKNKLHLHSLHKPIEYAYNDGDILATHDFLSTCIFFGDYNENSHLFNLRYILNFDREESISKEMNYLISMTWIK